MTTQYKTWIGLLLLCLLLMGCGGEEPAAEAEPLADKPDEIPMSAEVVVEPTEQTLWIDGEMRPAVELVIELLQDESVDYPVMAEIKVPEEQASASRVRFVVEIGSVEGMISNDTAAVLAGQCFDALKDEFERIAQQSLQAELAAHQTGVQTTSQLLTESQQALRAFQEAQRGLPQTDASRLERRKLERKVETLLEAKIELENAIDSTQKRIDREQHVKLTRVR